MIGIIILAFINNEKNIGTYSPKTKTNSNEVHLIKTKKNNKKIYMFIIKSYSSQSV